MNKFCYWFDWGKLLCVIVVMIFLPMLAGAVLSISVTLGRIEQNFKIVQELQQEVKRLDKLTECLEPAREIPGREQKQEPEAGDGF